MKKDLADALDLDKPIEATKSKNKGPKKKSKSIDTDPEKRKSKRVSVRNLAPKRNKSVDLELTEEKKKERKHESRHHHDGSNSKETSSTVPTKKSSKSKKGRKSKSSSSSEPVIEEAVAGAKMSNEKVESVQEEKEETEPDYLNENFVPKTMQERRKMLIARARKQAEVEAELHRKHVEAAKMRAKADLEMKKIEALAKLRTKSQDREQMEHMRAKLKQNMIDEKNKNAFESCRNMDAQLLERAEEIRDSLLDQERKGMVMIRPLAHNNRGQTAN